MLRRLSLVILAFTAAALSQRALAAPRNIVLILIDDMRYDTMSCAGHPFLKTPAMDRLAADGVRFRNAFVTTSLCSPSRATILSGLYAHQHNILNNTTLMPADIPTFPQLLQKSGYKTAFFGKWHMGQQTDQPRPGFDHWASFRGQGSYVTNEININGQHKKMDGYVTDLLTDMSLEWLRANKDGPFLLYLSHKAVHAHFTPAERHRALFSDLKIDLARSSLDTPENNFRRPRWVHAQRDSWHGINDMYYKQYDIYTFIRNYCRTLVAVDESVGRMTDELRKLGLYDSTLILFTSDNGFLFGEHGLIDKRCMYEPSIRVPMLMTCPELFKGGQVLDPMVLNLDIAPTLLQAAGLPVPESMQGMSFLELPRGPNRPWRTSFLYEYFWEPEYPETPTVFGVRTDRYKYVEYQGIWDCNELYDLKNDPDELHNRISTSRHKEVTPDAEYRETYAQMKAELVELRERYGALRLPTWRK